MTQYTPLCQPGGTQKALDLQNKYPDTAGAGEELVLGGLKTHQEQVCSEQARHIRLRN